MTAKHISRQPTALGRRFRITVSALALTATFGLVGASTSLADTGSVYFDGDFNTAAGQSLFNGTFTGGSNVGLGREVMPFLTTGDDNVAVGTDALVSNMTGNGNLAVGSRALQANSGSRNIALGLNAGQNLTTGSNNIDIANSGKAGEAKTIRIGTDDKQTATYIAGISTTPLGGAAQPVVVKSNGQLGTAPAAAASTTSLANTVEQLTDQLERQQRQIEQLREQVKGG